MNSNRGFIAVHVGAGYHSHANSDLYKHVCRQACLQAISLLQKNSNALTALRHAVMVLEDSPWTNAGVGSNLTIQGTVECDASIMDGKSLHYGAVGAVSGVKNPILIAENLLNTQKKGTLSLGRIPPSTLVGQGAVEWAKKNNIPTCSNDELITESSRGAFIKNKRKLDMIEDGFISGNTPKRSRLSSAEVIKNRTDGETDNKLDTVGAICVDDKGNVVSAVSSGGIVLKQVGRLGQAALFGSGCWAENDSDTEVGIGISTSGCGEHLSKTLLAKECAMSLVSSEDPVTSLSDTITDKFLKSPLLKNVTQKLGGALAVRVDSSRNEMDIEVLWAHTTDSMCLAFMSTSDSQPKAFISRLSDGKICGQSHTIQCKHCRIKRKKLA